MSLGLIEMIGFFGIVLGFAVYQLVSVNRSLLDDRDHDDERQKPDDPSKGSGA